MAKVRQSRGTSKAQLGELLKAIGLDPVRCRSCGRANDIGALGAALFEEILRRVSEGQEIHVAGFGVFAPKQLPSRDIRSGIVDATYRIPDMRTIRFYPSKAARRLMNPGAVTVRVDEPAAKVDDSAQTKKRGKNDG